jgi:hypothetical protein
MSLNTDEYKGGLVELLLYKCVHILTEGKNPSNTCLPLWCYVLLEKLRDSQLIMKFPVFRGPETSTPSS